LNHKPSGTSHKNKNNSAIIPAMVKNRATFGSIMIFI